MSIPQAESAKPASIISITTRQPMEPSKPKRGGKRDPLPRLTITIPNYGKYQQQAKRRDWAAVHKGIGRDSRMVQACERGLTPLAVFCVLLTLADNEGRIADVRAKDLSLEMCGVDPRTIMSGLDALASVGIISKQEANAEQALSKHKANAEQTVSVQSLHEDPSSDAALSAPTRQDKDKTEQENIRRKRSVGSPEFEAFWRDYPNKGPKPEALAQWQAINPDEGTVTAIMAGLAKAKASQRWADGYVVQACRFLRDERWLDDWPPAAVSRDELQATKDEFAAMFGTF